MNNQLSVDKDKRKYYKKIKNIFPVLGVSENKYLVDLKQQIDEYCDNESDVTYEKLTIIFGNPTEVATSFYTNTNNNDLVMKIRRKRIIKMGGIILTIIILVIAIYYFINLLNGYDYAQEGLPAYFEDTIEEIEE